ncbi:MAG: hypothetical protein RBT60_10930 [Candidatus Krumholzibacteria bacterium]|jgi:hypothetical protein|nr:hypothetical protein [Candidatus Krumholzibacteria bacterium]
MSGDGVSMPTTLSQLGQVAKAQARTQQTGATAAGPTHTHEKENVHPLRKVSELEKKDKQAIDDGRQNGGRRHDRHGESAADEDQAAMLDAPTDGAEDTDEEDTPPGAEPGLGFLIDTKA